MSATTNLRRPVGPTELELLRAAGWTRWPPRLPEHPIFYPVLNRDYAVRIASDFNVRLAARYVTELEVRRDYLDGFEVRRVGGATIPEYRIPAEELQTLNDNMVGLIRVADQFVAGGA